MGASKSTITIADVAKAAGVSTSAVSYALNGKKGVSEKTRARVLEVAESMGWRPNSAAKALSDSRSRSIGVVLLMHDTEEFASGSYAMECLAGLSRVLEEVDYSITLRMTTGGAAAACRIHRDWIESGRVDAHLVLGVEFGDPRLELFREHPDVPALFLAQQQTTKGLPTLYSQDDEGARAVVRHLHELGHTHIARVAGPEQYMHTLIRDSATMDECARLGMRCDSLHGEYMRDDGARLTSMFLNFSDHATAIVYDSDSSAIGGLHAVTAQGLVVPDDISLVSWDDSAACRSAKPPLTALHRDVRSIGDKAGRLLLRMIDGEAVGAVPEDPYTLVVRDSTAAPKTTD
ncbi:LacI family DNA-binding transcriptional regulator [Bifidobacterium callimiconis]|uniref:LacI family DNA-binding transcriptional regulator n=1 Tax=Bifidobacterium callimiconis TaxID=2306973 RepID=UPI001BDD3DE4|nr:LacI family DNA-binding transcriptional regulator [Bifidobacterium callimiconis]MBT1176945.1 LacI family DNA-binding transcriptional regulator [Bifidobacterium callimiconis]